jgi:nitroimidazol reductase NimA-like FMN-containing flavoprotein (pyridoxamine 5'-phosphate oxidase superfamily)
MSDEYTVSKQNKVRQLNVKANYDRETVHAILDAAQIAQVGFVQDGAPIVVPMIHGRDGETIYLHGARKARVIRLLEQTDLACLNVTLIDALVLARSAFNSSMNYRSATVYGTPSLVEDYDDKVHAMRVISEQLMPGRWNELREPLEREVKMTGVIAMGIDSASAKVSTGMPDDEDEDYDIPIWAGVLPLESMLTTLQTDDRVLEGVEASIAVTELQNRKL